MADQTPRLSINDILPPEILHCVFEYLEFDINHHEVLSACMRVCTLWHSLARPHFFVWILVWRDQERFSEFCRSHPDIAGCIKKIDFHGALWSSGTDGRFSTNYEAFDAERFVSTIPLLPSLRVIRLTGHDNREVTLDAIGGRDKLLRLNELCFSECKGLAMILPVLYSFLEVDTLVLSGDEADADRGSSVRHHPSAHRHSIAFPNLLVHWADHICPLLELCEYVLIPRCLCALVVKCRAGDSLSNHSLPAIRCIEQPPQCQYRPETP